MQHIQWHPGHMTKAYRMIAENLKLVDGVLYVLDARCPISCLNEKMIKLAANKNIVYILNKCDLIEKNQLKSYLEYFNKNIGAAVAVNATSAAHKKTLTEQVKFALAEKIAHLKSRGIVRPIRLMVTGVPNTGKSTLINMLSGAKKAATGNKAGVTKGKQWIMSSGIELLDTPGTTPPSFENQIYATRLAFVGSINDDILDMPELALSLIKELSDKKTNYIKLRYNVDTSGGALKTLEEICKTRGFMLRGNDFDFERGALAVIDDFRKGRMGKVALD